MKLYLGLGLAMLAGTAIGAGAINGLNAQDKAPGAYAIIEISKITDPNVFLHKETRDKGEASLKASGGHFVVRTNKIVASDGDAPKRLVIIGFDSMDQLKAWSESAAQKEVDAIRVKTTESRQFFVEGFSN